MVTEKENKIFYRDVENDDLTDITDNFKGLETFYHRYRVKMIRRVIAPYLNLCGQWLDVGCGTGVISRYLPSGSCGVDINERYINKAKKYAPMLDYSVSDIDNLPYDDYKFKYVVCTETLEHLIDPDKALCEILRVMSFDSVFMGSVPTNGLFWKFRFLSRSGGKDHEPFHKHFSQMDIDVLLSQYFKKIKFVPDLLNMNWYFVCQGKMLF